MSARVELHGQVFEADLIGGNLRWAIVDDAGDPDRAKSLHGALAFLWPAEWTPSHYAPDLPEAAAVEAAESFDGAVVARPAIDPDAQKGVVF